MVQGLLIKAPASNARKLRPNAQVQKAYHDGVKSVDRGEGDEDSDGEGQRRSLRRFL